MEENLMDVSSARSQFWAAEVNLKLSELSA